MVLYRVILVAAFEDIARSPFTDATFAIVSFFAFWTIYLNAPRFSGLIYFYCTKKYIKVAMPLF
jgi:hypothetical protein